MLVFNNQQIYGTHWALIPSAPDLQLKTTKFMGVNGESAIRGGRGGREISCHICIHNSFATARALTTFLRLLDTLVGSYGELRETRQSGKGIDQEPFRECVFLGFWMDPQYGIIPDLSGTLDGANPSWHCEGTLRWRQLSVEPQSPGQQ